jgi:hypothetical protein
MRIGPAQDDVAAEFRLIRALRPLARSNLPYVVLREAALGGLSAHRLAELRRLNHNAQRVIDFLTGEKLIKGTRGGGLNATARGKRLVEQIRRAADAGVGGELVGRRLILVRDAPSVDLSGVEQALGPRAEVLRSEGGFERIGVVDDDYALANELLHAVRQLGAKAEMTRVVEPAS